MDQVAHMQQVHSLKASEFEASLTSHKVILIISVLVKVRINLQQAKIA